MVTVVKTETQHMGEFLVSEGNGEISREKGVLTSGQKVADGRALKVVGGKLVATAGTLNSAGTSDEVIAGFAYGACDASATGSNADRDCVYIARMAEVKASNVVLHSVTGGGAAAATAAVKVALAKLFIFLR